MDCSVCTFVNTKPLALACEMCGSVLEHKRDLEAKEIDADREIMEVKSLVLALDLEEKNKAEIAENESIRLANAIAAQELAEREAKLLSIERQAWAQLNSIGIGGAVKTACPRCGVKYDVAAVNCGIFICGFYMDGEKQVQLPQHNEAFAQKLLQERRLTSGCGGQCRWDEVTQSLVVCSGK